MGIQESSDRIIAARDTLASWLTDKGVTVPTGALIDALVALLEEVQTGVDTTTSSPTSAEDIAEGKEAWANGKKITGNVAVTKYIASMYNKHSTNTSSVTLFSPEKTTRQIIDIDGKFAIITPKSTFIEIASSLDTASAAMLTAYQEGVDSV